MIELVGLSHAQLSSIVESLGQKPFREKQLWQWIYFFGETDFDKIKRTIISCYRKLELANFLVSDEKFCVSIIPR